MHINLLAALWTRQTLLSTANTWIVAVVDFEIHCCLSCDFACGTLRPQRYCILCCILHTGRALRYHASSGEFSDGRCGWMRLHIACNDICDRQYATSRDGLDCVYAWKVSGSNHIWKAYVHCGPLKKKKKRLSSE